MFVLRKAHDVKTVLQSLQKYNGPIGFVPTMGALHPGHLSLVKQSLQDNQITVVSIFVNPRQFNDKKDLINYPRTEQEDLLLLEQMSCSVLYLPIEEELFPGEGFEMPSLEISSWTEVLEGPLRPGHFEGVVQVVYRLLTLLQPQRIYMGLKDFQQQAIVGEMLRQSNFPCELVAMPTLREPSGLAMSSRNARLNDTQRALAAHIYATLMEVRNSLTTRGFEKSREKAIDTLRSLGFVVEYLEWVHAHTLKPMQETSQGPSVVLIAVELQGLRLIDNVLV
jgi:pantoate--beta-alanine ligase